MSKILEHLQQHPHGIGERYIREDRLHNEIARSAGKFAKPELPLSGAVEAKAPPQPEPDTDEDLDDDLDDPDLDDDHDPNETPKDVGMTADAFVRQGIRAAY